MDFRFARRLSDGLTARLEFDFVCSRGHAFSEYYVHGVVNEILSATIDPRLHRLAAGYAHPALGRAPSGDGRKKEIDFHVGMRATGDPLLCVEVKWADSSHADPKQCLSDVLRLALIKVANPSAECLFVLAGTNTGVVRRLSKPPIAAPDERGRRLLEFPRENRTPRMRSYPICENGVPLPHIAEQVNQVPSPPDSIRTTLISPASFTPKRFQALVWRVDL